MLWSPYLHQSACYGWLVCLIIFHNTDNVDLVRTEFLFDHFCRCVLYLIIFHPLPGTHRSVRQIPSRTHNTSSPPAEPNETTQCNLHLEFFFFPSKSPCLVFFISYCQISQCAVRYFILLVSETNESIVGRDYYPVYLFHGRWSTEQLKTVNKAFSARWCPDKALSQLKCLFEGNGGQVSHISLALHPFLSFSLSVSALLLIILFARLPPPSALSHCCTRTTLDEVVYFCVRPGITMLRFVSQSVR